MHDAARRSTSPGEQFREWRMPGGAQGAERHAASFPAAAGRPHRRFRVSPAPPFLVEIYPAEPPVSYVSAPDIPPSAPAARCGAVGRVTYASRRRLWARCGEAKGRGG